MSVSGSGIPDWPSEILFQTIAEMLWEYVWMLLHLLNNKTAKLLKSYSDNSDAVVM